MNVLEFLNTEEYKDSEQKNSEIKENGEELWMICAEIKQYGHDDQRKDCPEKTIFQRNTKQRTWPNAM